jgi:hypothetical protein
MVGPEREVADEDCSVDITIRLRAGGLRIFFLISGSKASKSALEPSQLILKGYTGGPFTRAQSGQAVKLTTCPT